MNLTRISRTPRFRRAAEINLETRHADRPLLPVAEIFAWRA